MPPKSNIKKKNTKITKINKKEHDLSDSSDSDQSSLSDNDFEKKNDDIEKKILQGGEEEFDEDDNIDEETDNDDIEENDDLDEQDEADDDEKDDKEEKESIQKNDEELKDEDDVDDDCVYRGVKKPTFIDAEEDLEEDEDHFMEDEQENVTKYISDENRITTNKMTKYERVNIISTRAKQIELGAQKFVSNTAGLNAKQIALKELLEKVCPLKIKRLRPDGSIEIVKANDLEIIN